MMNFVTLKIWHFLKEFGSFWLIYCKFSDPGQIRVRYCLHIFYLVKWHMLFNGVNLSPINYPQAFEIDYQGDKIAVLLFHNVQSLSRLSKTNSARHGNTSFYSVLFDPECVSAFLREPMFVLQWWWVSCTGHRSYGCKHLLLFFFIFS